EQQVDEVEQDQHAGRDERPAEPAHQPDPQPTTTACGRRRHGLLVGHGSPHPRLENLSGRRDRTNEDGLADRDTGVDSGAPIGSPDRRPHHEAT
ncbi:hypothetical protein DF186_14960, partial [Enterococcus hirae]